MFAKLDQQLKTVIVYIITLLGLSIILIPLFFFNLAHYVIGLIIGIALQTLYFFIDHYVSISRKPKLRNTITIILLITRFLILGGFMVLFAYLEYSLNIKIANIFALVGGYLIPLIIAIIIFATSRGQNGRSIK